MQEFYEVRSNPLQVGKGKNMTFPAHFHSEIEIVYLLKGELYAYHEQKEYHLKQGDIYISFPNQIHRYETKTSARHMMLIISPNLCEPYRNVLTENIPSVPLIRAESVPSVVDVLFQELYAETHSNEDYAHRTAGGLLLSLIGKLLRLLTLEKKSHVDLTTTQRVIHFCLEHYRSDISLDEVAKKINISKYHVSHIFSEKIKLSFNHYINRLRVGYAAEQLLSTEQSITEISFDSGFESTRTFNRAFLQFYGMSPKEYREKNSAGAKSDYLYHIHT